MYIVHLVMKLAKMCLFWIFLMTLHLIVDCPNSCVSDFLF